jgi:glucokinase
MMALRIGVDIGGTNLRVGVVDGLNIIYEARKHADFANLCKTNSADIAWQKIIAVTAEILNKVLAQYSQVESIGIGFPGFIDPHNGHVAQSPNLPGLLDVSLAGDLSAVINRPVIVENDALAAAYGEYQLMQIPASEGLIFMGLGTGVGGGLIQAGEAVAGEHGFAMEVGHLITTPNGRLCGCGNHGCLEQYASATGISKSYEELSGTSLAAHEIAERASQGDVNAKQAYEIAATALAQSLAHILKVLDVKRVVIGGGVSQAWYLMEASFNQQLNADLIPVLRGRVQVEISSTGDKAGIVGAALLSVSKA